MTLGPGTTLGPYEVLAPLGAGGMGEVYRARDSKLARDVAIKVLPESVASDAKALARFEHEARAVAALSHPNILSIFDFGTHDGTTYAVTELLEGETFRELLRRGPLSPRRATELATQVAHGLAAAHGKGVVHRDLKPENLFLTADGLVKILDFGVAHRTEPVKPGEETSAATVSRQTDPGAVIGTVGYMAPEQVRGEVVDHRSDLFSFGTVLYELLTGRQAFRRGSAAETMAAVLNEEPPEIEATGKPVPQGLKRIVEHCLEKSATKRFHDAEDLAFALESATGNFASAEQPATPASSRRRTIPLLAASAAVVLALALALPLGVLVGRAGRPEASAPPRYTQLTFTENPVVRGRFTHDGRSVVYSEWPEGIRELTLGMALPRPVLGENTRVLSVSATDQLAVALEPGSPSF
ncbi:serine/threonine protein kinase, partial [bacterium]|nr:serine/threonine protein kinase [bacterium]